MPQNDVREIISIQKMPGSFYERFLDAMLSELPSGVCVNKTGINPEYVVWNQTLEKMTGIQASDALGATCYKLFSTAEADKITARNAITLKNGKVSKYSSSVLTGKLYDIIEIPFAGQEGAVLYIISIFTDITEQRKIMERLVHAEKMQVTGQLAGGIAHDFNNQLMSIQGYASLIKEKLSDPELLKYMEMILTSAERSAALTGKLLAFSRKGKHTDERINIHILMDDAASLAHFRFAGSSGNIIFRKNYNADKKHTRGDVSLLQNAFLNLIINSMEAIRTGEVGIIRLQTENICIDSNSPEIIINDIKSGQYVRVTIADNGVGIKQENIKRVFEPFFTTKKAGGGTGMGLAAVFGTVKSHNGTLGIESTPEAGTSISIYLPVEEDNCDDLWIRLKGEKNNKKKEDAGLMDNNERKKILVVDDEKIVRDLSGEMLKRLGYDSELFDNAFSAISYYKDNWKNISLVMLDMIMPLMGGLEAFRELKKINPDISAIILSGYCLDDESKELFDEGIYAFIQKPVSLSALKEKIESALKNNDFSDTPDNSAECNQVKSGSSKLEKPPVIEGVDTKKALNFIDGDISLYYQLIERFKQSFTDIPDELEKRYLEKDYNWIYTTAHSLKSLAGSLGDNSLSEASEKVEDTVKNMEYPLLAAYIPELSIKINRLLKVIESALNHNEKDSAAESAAEHSETDNKPSGYALSSFVHELKEAVFMHSPKKCRELFEKSKSMQWESHVKTGIDEAEKAVSVYDFKKAGAILIEMENKLF